MPPWHLVSRGWPAGLHDQTSATTSRIEPTIFVLHRGHCITVNACVAVVICMCGFGVVNKHGAWVGQEPAKVGQAFLFVDMGLLVCKLALPAMKSCGFSKDTTASHA